jgi:hypothetical protein
MRKPTVNNPAEGHRANVYRFSRGRAFVTGRTQGGTKMRCECGWSWKCNEGPPSSTRKKQNAAYQAHLEETDA